jgi:hypothetical protein
MKLHLGFEGFTRDGRKVIVLRPLLKDNGGNFVKASRMCDFIVSVEGKLERYNGDGTYIKPQIRHPLDIVSEKS